MAEFGKSLRYCLKTWYACFLGDVVVPFDAREFDYFFHLSRENVQILGSIWAMTQFFLNSPLYATTMDLEQNQQDVIKVHL